MTPRQAIAFVERHGIVLERSHGVLACLVEAVVGAPVRGSWWSHPDAHHIFRILSTVHDSPDVLRCRLVDEKITYCHRRVWPALVRLASKIGPRRLDRQVQKHTASGAHRTVSTRFPKWVPADVTTQAKSLSEEDALRMLAPFVP
jgi:hypothetical protein